MLVYLLVFKTSVGYFDIPGGFNSHILPPKIIFIYNRSIAVRSFSTGDLILMFHIVMNRKPETEPIFTKM